MICHEMLTHFKNHTQVQVSTRLREGFPGETFRVLKEKEIKQFGALGVNL